MRFVAEAPSNIALIKYMGKRDAEVSGAQKNLPVNSSISLSLPEFRTRIEIRGAQGQDLVTGFTSGEWQDPKLSASGSKKFLDFFGLLKREWKIAGNFEIKSANNFPADCGVASSASSFAALTLATYELAKSQNPNLDLNLNQLAMLSRLGSGSSCRSFGPDFVLWRENSVTSLKFDTEFHHELILVDQEKKSVSSSEAHRLVTASSMFAGRPERAEKRLGLLLTALDSKKWSTAWQIVWDEYWDMHTLFHTSVPPFRYMTEKSFLVLEFLRLQNQSTGDAPFVTMDAGANIHLVYGSGQKSISANLLSEFEGLKVLVGRRG